MLELIAPAEIPSWARAVIWSCINAIKGETITPTPSLQREGIW